MGWGERPEVRRSDFTLEADQAMALARELLVARRLLGEWAQVMVTLRGRQLHLDVFEDAFPRWRATVHVDGLVTRDMRLGYSAPEASELLAQMPDPVKGLARYAGGEATDAQLQELEYRTAEENAEAGEL